MITKKDTGKMFALKLIEKEFIVKNKKQIIVQNERNIMTQISHPFLLRLEYAFESKDYLGFVMVNFFIYFSGILCRRGAFLPPQKNQKNDGGCCKILFRIDMSRNRILTRKKYNLPRY